jgi:hypothetical protein
MHFTVTGLFALAMAVAATPVAVQVSNDRRSVSAPSEQLWHATPEKGVNFNELQQKCGNLIVSCCNQVNNDNNGNTGLSGSGLTAAIIGALGVLPGYANSACAPASSLGLGTGVAALGALLAGQRMCTIYLEQHVSSTYILS